jgi:hypothetical protein
MAEPAESAPTGEPGPAPPQVRGRITGPALAEVVAVVLHGPDDVLREAGRVRPAADGAWEIDGLAPGLYRVHLDGGGARVLITEPRFLILRIEAGRPATAPDLRVLRSL